MRTMTEAELTARIRAFIDKKSAQYPELRYTPRFVRRSTVRHTQFDVFTRLRPSITT